MKTIAITNQKGGSGKTTTAVNVSAAMAELGEHVLLLDLDPQASASAWLDAPAEGRGLFDVFAGNVLLADLVRNTNLPNLEVVPSSRWLTGIDKALANEVGAETLLRAAIGTLSARWDYLIVDCPPSLGLLGVAALAAADGLLVPVETRVMALAGLASLLNTTERVRERLNPRLAIEGILACRVDVRTNLSREVVSRLRNRFGDLVFNVVIRENVRLAEAPSFQQPITTFAPTSTGTEDYRSLARELRARHRGSIDHEQEASVARPRSAGPCARGTATRNA